MPVLPICLLSCTWFGGGWKIWSRRRESNPHEAKLRQILSLLRLPVPPLRAVRNQSNTPAANTQDFHRPPADLWTPRLWNDTLCSPPFDRGPPSQGGRTEVRGISWPALLPFPRGPGWSTVGLPIGWTES